MENSSDPGRKSPEKRGVQQGGNLVWYALGMGVALLLLLTICCLGSTADLCRELLVWAKRGMAPEILCPFQYCPYTAGILVRPSDYRATHLQTV